MTDIEMKSEYKGYVIEWEDFYRNFKISKEGVEVKKNINTLEECQKWINFKIKQKFKRVPILYNFNYRDEKVSAEASSIVDDEYVWVTSGKDRAKATIADVWLDNSKNRKAIDDINARYNKIEQLRNEIKNIEKSTDRLSADMMIEK